MATCTANILRKGVSTMWASGRMATGIAAGALLTMINLGCAAKQPEIKDTWTAAATQANSSASRAEAAASRTEAGRAGLRQQQNGSRTRLRVSKQWSKNPSESNTPTKRQGRAVSPEITALPLTSPQLLQSNPACFHERRLLAGEQALSAFTAKSLTPYTDKIPALVTSCPSQL